EKVPRGGARGGGSAKTTGGSHGPGGSHSSFSLSVSLYCLPAWNVDSVTILICFFPDLQTSPGNGPASGTRMLLGVVQRSGVLVGVSIWLPMRFCSAWKSVSNFGSPLSTAC